MKVKLIPVSKKHTYIIKGTVEGDDNDDMHENFAKCIAQYRGMDPNIVVEKIDMHIQSDSIHIKIKVPYGYSNVKDGLNKVFNQHGLGIK